MKKKIKIKAGELVQISTGCYSDYSIQSSFVALKDFVLNDIFRAIAIDLISKGFPMRQMHQSSLYQNIHHYKLYHGMCKNINDDHIYNYLLRNEFIVPLDIREINLNDNYGSGIEELFPDDLDKIEKEWEKQMIIYIENRDKDNTEATNEKVS